LVVLWQGKLGCWNFGENRTKYVKNHPSLDGNGEDYQNCSELCVCLMQLRLYTYIRSSCKFTGVCSFRFRFS